jgi:tetratricopeptide (TPR) repeat protein
VIGQTVSHYRIVSALGSGGMGVVYEAEDTRLGRHVAVKMLPPEACCDPQAMERFLREARIVSSLSHPHICTLHDIGEHDGQQFMVMELLEGESLRERLARGPLRVDDLLDFGWQIADALDAAHAAAVVHRDIKPANLFITRRGQAKVLDFGVAKLSESGGHERPDLATTIAGSEQTTTGSAIGTIAYMSPEQARGQDIDSRSDLFSFGVVLYEMATGRQPFAGATQAVIFEGILSRQPIPPSQLNANIPPDFDRIVAKALEKDRETRYQSASDMRADLKRLKRDTESGRMAAAADPYPVSPTVATAAAAPAGRRVKRALMIGAPLAAAAAIVLVVLWQSQDTPAALRERDTAVLADFRNRTGDTMFDDTLTEALGVQLRQSPFLNLMPEQQVEATLRLMGRSPDDAVTPEVAREICQRAAAKAVLGGTIANIGNTYLLTLSAQDCVDGRIVAEEQTNASGKDEVLNALGDVTSRFREKLGESLASVQRYDANIEQATTKSLEALKAYSQGMVTRRTKGDADSLPFFRRAVEADPEFALAHARLGTVLNNLGQADEARSATTRAYEMRDKVSERERLYIEARYHTTVSRDPEKAMAAYRLSLATYPDDYVAHSNLGIIYRERGMLKEATASLEEAVRLAPMQPISRNSLAGAYSDLGRLDDALTQYDESLKLLPDGVNARRGAFVTATLLGRHAQAADYVAGARGEGDKTELLAMRVLAAQYRGRMKEANTLTDEFVTRLVSANRVQFAGEGLLGFALGDALVGRVEAARAGFERAKKLGVIGDRASDEAYALGVFLGDRRLAAPYRDAALDYARKNNTVENVPKAERMFHALDALLAGRHQEVFDLATSVGSDFAQRNTLFVAAAAAAELRRWDDAVRIYETLAGFGPRSGLSPTYGAVQILLARALVGAGRTADARKAYEKAFEIWKDADPDLPLLAEAKTEYQRLGT